MRPQAALLALLLLGGVAAGVAAGSPSGSPEADSVVLDVRVGPDGDARWNVSARYVLDSEADREAFSRLAEEVRNGGDVSDFSPSTFRALADRAANETGRDMRVDGVERYAGIETRDGRSVGVVAMAFRWTGFAAADDTAVRVGDSFAEEWRLADGQRLVLHPPADYAIDEAEPSPDLFQNGSLMWNGSETFAAGAPTVRYVPASPPDGTTTTTTTATRTPTATPTATTTTPAGPALGGNTALLVGTGIVALLLGGLVAYAWAQRAGGDGAPPDGAVAQRPDDDAPPETSASADPADAAAPASDRSGNAAGGRPPSDASASEGASADASPGGVDPSDGAGDAGGEHAAGAGAAARTEDASEESGPDRARADEEGEDGDGGDSEDRGVQSTGGDAEAVPPELLSDEEQVERLLADNGGRMKQATIVEETGWSNAKVSQLLSSMAEEERVDKLRIGRENLISLEGADEAGGDGEP